MKRVPFARTRVIVARGKKKSREEEEGGGKRASFVAHLCQLFKLLLLDPFNEMENFSPPGGPPSQITNGKKDTPKNYSACQPSHPICPDFFSRKGWQHKSPLLRARVYGK